MAPGSCFLAALPLGYHMDTTCSRKVQEKVKVRLEDEDTQANISVGNEGDEIGISV